MEVSPLTVLLLAPAAVLLAVGLLLLALFLLGNVMQVDVHFESSDGNWADIERTFKGYHYPTLVRAFEEYRSTAKGPVSLMRTTQMDWRMIQLWPTYLINPKWRVPYSPRTVAAEQLLPPTARSTDRDAQVAALAAEYLDSAKAAGTLVDMLGYIDHRHRVIPTVEEINEALRQRPAIRVTRVGGSVLFPHEGSEQSITAADMTRAYAEYRQRVRMYLETGSQ